MAEQQGNIDRLKELLGKEPIAADELYKLKWAGKTQTGGNLGQAGPVLIEGESLCFPLCKRANSATSALPTSPATTALHTLTTTQKILTPTKSAW
jgi:hypothetical protein